MQTPSRNNVAEFLKMVRSAKGRVQLDDLYEMEMNLVVHEAEDRGLVRFEETYPEKWTEVHLTWDGEVFLSEWRWRWLGPFKKLLEALVTRLAGG
jgi:hypothetical protein